MSSSLILPGERALLPQSASSITIGPGISQSALPISAASSSSRPSSQTCIATKLGILHTGKGKERSQKVWIESNSKRYIPAQKDMVLGTVIARHAEGYRVDLGSSQMAQLDALAFEGATKRSKPNLKVGTLVFARVLSAMRDMEPEIECFDPNTGKSDGFGELKGGVMVKCSLQLCRQWVSFIASLLPPLAQRLTPLLPFGSTNHSLLNRSHILLPTIASVTPFEIAIGLNGRLWLKAETISETIAMKRLIESVDSYETRVEEVAIKGKWRHFLA
nr:exosome complex component RRP40 [Cryptococcus depauperatus CBS 7855]